MGMTTNDAGATIQRRLADSGDLLDFVEVVECEDDKSLMAYVYKVGRPEHDCLTVCFDKPNHIPLAEVRDRLARRAALTH